MKYRPPLADYKIPDDGNDGSGELYIAMMVFFMMLSFIYDFGSGGDEIGGSSIDGALFLIDLTDAEHHERIADFIRETPKKNFAVVGISERVVPLQYSMIEANSENIEAVINKISASWSSPTQRPFLDAMEIAECVNHTTRIYLISRNTPPGGEGGIEELLRWIAKLDLPRIDTVNPGSANTNVDDFLRRVADQAGGDHKRLLHPEDVIDG